MWDAQHLADSPGDILPMTRREQAARSLEEVERRLRAIAADLGAPEAYLVDAVVISVSAAADVLRVLDRAVGSPAID